MPNLVLDIHINRLKLNKETFRNVFDVTNVSDNQEITLAITRLNDAVLELFAQIKILKGEDWRPRMKALEHKMEILLKYGPIRIIAK